MLGARHSSGAIFCAIDNDARQELLAVARPSHDRCFARRAARAAGLRIAHRRRPEAAAGDRHRARPCALPNGLLARVAYAHEGDPTAATRLATQAEAFRHLAPAGRTPRLHDVIEPRPGLPGGALIVDRIDGRAPRLPDELGAMADTLARIHALPLPSAGSPIPRQTNPLLETLEAIEQNAARFLDKAVPDPARAPRSPTSCA